MFEGWCRFFPTGIFRFKTGVTSREPKAVEPVDDQEEESMMCWLQYVLPQFWAGDSDVPSAIFPHAVVANIPYILPIIPELFLVFLLPNYSRSRGYSRIFFRLFRNYSLVFLLPIIPKLFQE